eukprot:Skav229751  [mRNA]  locus=scaffold1796:13711:14709:+ [translate_table: standard]
MKKLEEKKARIEGKKKNTVDLDEIEPDASVEVESDSGDEFIYTISFDDICQKVDGLATENVAPSSTKVKLTIVPEGDKTKCINLFYNPEETTVDEIYRDIIDITDIPLGGFVLIDPQTMTPWAVDDYLKSFENEKGEYMAFLRLKLKGGGVIRGIDKKKKETKSKKDIALEEMMENVDEMKADFAVSKTTIDAIANANAYATQLHDLATKNGNHAFQKLMDAIPDDELKNITNYNTNRAEGKVGHIVKMLLKHNIPDLDALMAEADTVYSTCYAVVELVVNMEFLSEGGTFRYTQLDDAIKIEEKVRTRAKAKSSAYPKHSSQDGDGDTKMG